MQLARIRFESIPTVPVISTTMPELSSQTCLAFFVALLNLIVYYFKMLISLVREIFYVFEAFIAGICDDLRVFFVSCSGPDPIRETASSLSQFYLCIKRSFKQIFAGFSPFVMEMFLHLLCGAVISSAAKRLAFLGPLPTPICVLQSQPLQAACAAPQDADYVQVILK